MSDHTTVLRALLRPDPAGRRSLLSLPGCWDGLSALLIEQAGFPAAFLTGGGVSFARFGRPDMGLVGMTEVAETIAVIRDRVAIPLLVDADTGFGNALNVTRTVRLFERAGASAIQLEDQAFPKRCGHMAGKAVIPLKEAAGKIRAALDARSNALIVARTDAAGVEGMDAALDRAEAYLDEGADLIFVEGPRSMDDMRRVADRLAARVPLIHNLVEGGVTPVRDGDALEKLGFAMALHPLLLLHGLAAAAPGWLSHLREKRTTDGLPLVDLAAMNIITGAPELLALGQDYER